MKKWIDLPPVWLVCFLFLGWLIGRILPLRLFGEVGAVAGAGLIGAGLLLMAWAVVEMRRARTTVIPHQEPVALVTTGPFSLSRNPIYLADAMILSGAILWWDAAVALLLVPVFMRLISHRFIHSEEDRLARGFGPAWDAWSLRVRRWL